LLSDGATYILPLQIGRRVREEWVARAKLTDWRLSAGS